MIIYKTLNSNISATTQYNDFVWGDDWGNIWGVGYSTEMLTIMTRAKPILSQTLSYITTKRATDKKISATTKVYNQIKREVTRLVTSSSKISSLITKLLRLQKQIAAITNTSNKIIDNVKKIILSMSVIMSAKNIKNSTLTYIKELSSVLIVNISTKKHIKKLIAVIVDMLNLKNVKTFKSIEAIITAYETINKIINSTIKGITTTLALTSKGIKKSINVISNILSVEIYNLRFIKILSTAISVVASILAKFKPVVIDVTFKLGIPKNIIFNLTENQDIAFTLTQDNDVTIQADDITDLIYDSKLDKYTK
ncbi:MAG: hypothetical protein ACOX2Z_00060 [Minisyncoccales bacterium]|jgi:hypothetical protein